MPLRYSAALRLHDIKHSHITELMECALSSPGLLRRGVTAIKTLRQTYVLKSIDFTEFKYTLLCVELWPVLAAVTVSLYSASPHPLKSNNGMSQ